MAIRQKTTANLDGNSKECQSDSRQSIVGRLASVRITITLLVLLAATVALGAWCPQEPQFGRQKVIEQFGETMAVSLSRFGVTDIFHSLWFLLLIGLLTLNMVACSTLRVFPRMRLLRNPRLFPTGEEIRKLPLVHSFSYNGKPGSALALVEPMLREKGYRVSKQDHTLAAESGGLGRFAAVVTHTGLLLLLLGVTVTSWTGFSGFKAVRPGDRLSFENSEHSKLWMGSLPDWQIKVTGTSREDYPSGQAKQWYSHLMVIDRNGREMPGQTISVNHPFSFQGVDIYQSSWGMSQILVSFNGHRKQLDLTAMGNLYLALLPLDKDTLLFFSVDTRNQSLKIFARRREWEQPRLLGNITRGQAISLGAVKVRFEDAIPVTGLQYKSDPVGPQPVLHLLSLSPAPCFPPFPNVISLSMMTSIGITKHRPPRSSWVGAHPRQGPAWRVT